MNWIYVVDIIGTLVFAISGALAAIEKKFDLVGAFILALVTAVGGGTLRDILIGQTPVSWMNDLNYLWVILASLVLTYFFQDIILKWRKSMFLFDSIGIGLFTIIGLQKALALQLHPIIAILMGTVSAVFGGVIRDVLSNEVPLIFRKEIYASACFVGGLVFITLESFVKAEHFNMLIAMSVIFAIRYLSVKYRWALNFK